jgi:predicted outer membrane repeat protein
MGEGRRRGHLVLLKPTPLTCLDMLWYLFCDVISLTHSLSLSLSPSPPPSPQGTLTLTQVTLRENDSAVRNEKGGVVDLVENCVFFNNSGTASPPFLNLGCIRRIVGCTFLGNTCDDDGGAISNGNNIDIIEDSHFASNYAEDGGGAIDNYGRIGLLRNVTFEGNRAGQEGGALNNDDTAAVIEEIRDTIFRHNVAGAGVQDCDDKRGGKGGALCSEGEIGLIVGTQFIENEASPYGGAIAVESGVIGKINATRFSGNGVAWCSSTALDSDVPAGGAIWLYLSTSIETLDQVRG